MADEIGELVRRVVGRVLSERGASPEPAMRAASGGVHVHSRSAAKPEPPPCPARAAELVTAGSLAGIPDGGSLALPKGARVTPLAREEARRRGIALGSGSGASTGGALRVAVAADHGGLSLKREVVRWLAELGHRAFDLGTHDETPVDYPDFAAAVGREVAEGRADLGVCVDGAGIGSAMAANKIPGARAAACWDEASARNAREHNFANVLTLGGRSLQPGLAERILRAFIETPEGAERHARRVAKIAELERRASGRAIPVRRVRAPAAGEGTDGACGR